MLLLALLVALLLTEQLVTTSLLLVELAPEGLAQDIERRFVIDEHSIMLYNMIQTNRVTRQVLL